MEKDIQVGPEAVLKMSVVAGKVRFEIDYVGKQMSAGSFAELEVEAYASLLKAAIPGGVDDMIIDGLIAAMKLVP